jgi:pimeloyl-ACP methyl ester carboxylesterase
MAAMPGNPIARLVANDAGMIVPKAALERIATYVGKAWKFPSFDALEDHVRRAYAPFGALSDVQWRHLTTTSSKQLEDGSWANAYDPAIGHAFEGELADVDLSAYWDAIKCPTLLLRGADSDVLPRDVAQAMTQRGPKARLIELEGVGHAPMLLDEAQVSLVRSFLLEPR